MSLKKFTRVIIFMVLVCAIALCGPVTGAMAATGSMYASNDFTPSGNKYREFMLNVTSSLLGNAMPQSWQREQLANQYKYNHSWEGLAAQFGTDPANPNYAGQPDSYQDYVLKRQEMDMKGGSGGKRFGAPATKPGKWQKFSKLGGGLMSLTAFPIGTMLGNLGMDTFGGFFGFDAEGAVCGQGDGWGKDVSQVLTGRDCSMWAPTSEYMESALQKPMQCVANPDAKVLKAFCTTYVGQGMLQGTGSSSNLHKVFLCTWMEFPPKSTVNGKTFSVRSWRYEFEDGFQYTTGASVAYDSIYRKLAPGSDQSGIVAAACPTGMAHDTIDLQGAAAWETWKSHGDVVDFYPLDSSQSKRVETVPYDGEYGGKSEEFELECEIELDNGATVRSKGKPYSPGKSAIAPPECPPIPDGTNPVNVKINETEVPPPGTSTPPKKTNVSTEPVTPEYKEWRTKFPECGTGACKLDLIQKPKASCFDLENTCAEWHTDPNKTSKYECRYGTKTVDLKECDVYAGLFKPGRVETQTPYTDPKTGLWSGGKNTPGDDKKAFNKPVQNPAKTRECDLVASTGSFDPIRFIMRPVQCAMEWAFAPRPAFIEAELAGGDAAWKNKPPAAISQLVKSFAPAPSASGCSKSVDIFSGSWKQTVTPINACPGSWSAPLAQISRIATAAVMVVLVVIVLRRQISAMVGYGSGQ